MRHALAILVLSLSACAAPPRSAEPPRSLIAAQTTQPVTQPAVPQTAPVVEAIVLEVHDGDTIFVELMYSETSHELVWLRLRDVFAAELWAPGGKEARAKLAAVVPVGSRVTVLRFPVKSEKPWGPRYLKSFDRFISEVWTADGRYVNGLVQ